MVKISPTHLGFRMKNKFMRMALLRSLSLLLD